MNTDLNPGETMYCHTAATNLIAGKVDVRTVASILGHSNASVTLNLYAHLIEGAERAALDVLADRLGNVFSERSA
jgi:integrase